MDNAAVEKLLGEQKTLFEGFKEQNDKRLAEIKELGEAKAQTKEVLEKIEKRFDEIDKTLAVMNRPEWRKLEPGEAPMDEKALERKAAFNKFLRQGKEVLTPDERKVLLVADDTTGGFLAPAELALEIDKNIVEISPMRQHARVRTTSQRSVMAPTRTGTPSATFVGEGKAPSTSQSSYGLDQIHTHILAATVEVSQEDLEDSGFDLEAEIREDVAEQFATAEGNAFVVGNGENKPKGFTQDTAINSTDTTTSLVVDEGNDLIDLLFRLKSFYWPSVAFFMHRTYIGAVRKIKDVDGQYLWQPGLNGPTQSMLLGRPVVELPDMANTTSPTAGDVVVAAADMRRAYWIVDRRQMAVVRDDLTKADQGVIRFIFRKRVGGQTRRIEAIELLDLKA